MMDFLIGLTTFVYITFNLAVSVVLFLGWYDHKQDIKYSKMHRCSNCKHCNRIMSGKSECMKTAECIAEPSYCKYWESIGD